MENTTDTIPGIMNVTAHRVRLTTNDKHAESTQEETRILEQKPVQYSTVV